MANIIGNVYEMTNVTVIPKEFKNANGETVFFFEIFGKIADCRQKLKANVDRVFFSDFLSHYATPIGKVEE